MRPKWAAIAALGLWALGPTALAADERVSVGSDRVAFVDFSKIDDKVETDRDAKAYRLGVRLRPILERVALDRKATLVIDRSRALLLPESFDVTDDLNQRARRAQPKPSESIPPASLAVAHKKTIVEHGGTRNFEAALRRVASNRGANIVLNRGDVVLGSTVLDVTTAVVADLKGARLSHKSTTPLPALRIMAIDRFAVLRESRVCQDLRAQVEAERKNLDRRGPGADPQRTERLRAALKTAEQNARTEIETALGQILDALMIKGHATLLLDTKRVAYAPPDRDMTRDVIADLDKRLPRLTTPIGRRMEKIANERD